MDLRRGEDGVEGAEGNTRVNGPSRVSDVPGLTMGPHESCTPSRPCNPTALHDAAARLIGYLRACPIAQQCVDLVRSRCLEWIEDYTGPGG